jgi:hypothetical protein
MDQVRQIGCKRPFVDIELSQERRDDLAWVFICCEQSPEPRSNSVQAVIGRIIGVQDHEFTLELLVDDVFRDPQGVEMQHIDLEPLPSAPVAADARTYRLHGLNVRTQHQLSAPTVLAEPDVDVIDLAPRRPTLAMPRGTIVAGSPNFFAAASDADGHTIRYFEWCDFRWDPSRKQLFCQPHASMIEGYDSVLLESSVLAWVLWLMGHKTLHASAIEYEGAAVAIGGTSNAGKSSIAALAALGGASVVSDDLVRVETAPSAVCYRGSSELRIRDAVRHLAERSPMPRRATPDGRIGLQAPPIAAETMPLACIVLPVLADTVEVRELTGSQALTGLIPLARLLWAPGPAQRRHFADMAEVAKVVRVLSVRAPWRHFISSQDDEAVLSVLGAWR